MRNTKQITLATLVLALGMIIFGNTQAFAVTRQVDDNPGGTGQCPGATFTSIQAAVNVSVAGDTVQVCPGIYPEQVSIAINNFTLTGLIAGNGSRPEIRPPATGAVQNSMSFSPIGALVLVTGQNVNVFNLTVNGLSQSGVQNGVFTGPNMTGIFYRNASGTILNNAVKNIKSPNPGLRTSRGIFVFTSDGVTRRVDILNNVVLDYEATGIVVNELGSRATVAGNYVFGLGLGSAPNFPAEPGIAQDGIQIGFGAIANVNNNRVSENLYAGCGIPNTACSSNILILESFTGDPSAGLPQLVQGNNLSKGNFGITVLGAASGFNPTNGSTFQLNLIHATELGDGINIDGNTNSIFENLILGTDGTGISISGGTGNSITNNVINDAAIGIRRVDVGNTQSNNTFINADQNRSPGPPVAFRPTLKSKENTGDGIVKFNPIR